MPVATKDLGHQRNAKKKQLKSDFEHELEKPGGETS